MSSSAAARFAGVKRWWLHGSSHRGWCRSRPTRPYAPSCPCRLLPLTAMFYVVALMQVYYAVYMSMQVSVNIKVPKVHMSTKYGREQPRFEYSMDMSCILRTWLYALLGCSTDVAISQPFLNRLRRSKMLYRALIHLFSVD